MRYTGTIKSVNPKGWGFISRKSLKLADGRSAHLETTKDIYLHQDDLSGVFPSEDLEVTFAVTRDERRSAAFRAFNATPVVKAPALVVAPPPSGIELHVSDEKVDNPSIQMRWCFPGETHKYITENLRRGFGYAVMIIAKQRNDSRAFREIREVKNWSQPFTITTFGAPGIWDVSAVLFERKFFSKSDQSNSSVLEQGLTTAYLSRETPSESGHRPFRLSLPDLHEFASESTYHENSYAVGRDAWSGKPIAVRTITIDIPAEIFAQEPSAARKAFANYFFKHRSTDQCDFRRRFWLIMVPVGWVPYIFLEIAKRLLLILLGIGMALFLVKDCWKVIIRAISPSIKVTIDGGNEYLEQLSPFNINEGKWFWFTPGFLVLWSGLAILLYWVIQPAMPYLKKFGLWVTHLFTASHAVNHAVNTVSHDTSAESGYGIIIFWATIALIWFVVYRVRRHLAWRKTSYDQRLDARMKRQEERRARAKEMALDAGKKQALLAEQHASALVCGDAPAEVTIQAIPKELRNHHMIFADFKRKVCRPFAR